MPPHERFEAWRNCHALALETYRETRRWPRDERFELTAQTRRAALSAPANFAEGCAKRGPREFRRYLDITIGSLAELAYLLRFARDLGVLDQERWEDLDRLRDRAGRQTWRLCQALDRAARRP